MNLINLVNENQGVVAIVGIILTVFLGAKVIRRKKIFQKIKSGNNCTNIQGHNINVGNNYECKK